MRVVTFNVRCINPFDFGNGWSHRRELFVTTLRGFDADLVGLQEVTPQQQGELAKALPEYAAVSIPRDDGKNKGEASSIFYRTARFDLRDSGTFWLSETPDVVGSRGWDAACVRVCTWAKLRDKTAGRDVLIVNTHLDHVGPHARTNAAKLIAARLPKLAGDAAVIVTGDFNCEEDSDAYAALVKPDRPDAVPLADAYRAAHPARTKEDGTFHGFKGHTVGPRIDWILHSPALTTVACAIDRTSNGKGRYPSDHFAVVATLRSAN